jgi:hypothetical protein
VKLREFSHRHTPRVDKTGASDIVADSTFAFDMEFYESMSIPVDAKRPSFRGLSWQKDAHFSFMRPIDWHQFDWLDDRQGVIFGPSPADNATLFAVDVRDIGVKVMADDIADLEAGFLDGVEQLPDSHIEWHDRWVAGAVIGFEAKYTFREEGVTRKRWVRLLYQDTRQIIVTAQGATEADFNYWMPMFNQQMMTFKIHARGAQATAPDTE